MSVLKRTPIFPEYENLRAKTIDFGGWEMPVQFTSIKHEHKVTRTKAGLFDVSHMGEIVVKGTKSLEFLQKMVTNDVSTLTPKRAQYTFMCNEDGGTIDDFLIYMVEKNHYLLVVNAANTKKDFSWLTKHNVYTAEELTITDESDYYALLSIQGPKAEEILQLLTETNVASIKFFRFETLVYFSSIKEGAIVSRTGYTGEDGFEIYLNQAYARKLWNVILDVGKEKGLEPAGLGARDTLRFEASLPLYGQELSENISPIEAGMAFAVKTNKEDAFIGKEKLTEQVKNGPNRCIVGIEMIDKGIPRHGYPVIYHDQEIGVVTSGTQSPTLEKSIGLVLVQTAFAEIGTEFYIQVRKKQRKAVVVSIPFYQRKK